MQHQDHHQASSDVNNESLAAAQRATSRLSKQAFREMLAAAERVNRHYTAHLSQQRPS